jgi:hypothetical protein
MRVLKDKGAGKLEFELPPLGDEPVSLSLKTKKWVVQ